MSNQNLRTLAQQREDADRLMSGVVGFLLLVSFAMASWYGTWAEAIFIGVPAALIPIFIATSLHGSLISRIAIGASFMIFSALMIHQAHGMIEFHFGIFVLLAFLLQYRDWVPALTSAALIAVHHIAFYIMQDSAMPLYVLPTTNGLDGFFTIILHAILKQRYFGIWRSSVPVHPWNR